MHQPMFSPRLLCEAGSSHCAPNTSLLLPPPSLHCPLLQDALYNFVGLVLGHGGATVQRIQKASGAKIEVCVAGRGG